MIFKFLCFFAGSVLISLISVQKVKVKPSQIMVQYIKKIINLRKVFYCVENMKKKKKRSGER